MCLFKKNIEKRNLVLYTVITEYCRIFIKKHIIKKNKLFKYGWQAKVASQFFYFYF